MHDERQKRARNKLRLLKEGLVRENVFVREESLKNAVVLEVEKTLPQKAMSLINPVENKRAYCFLDERNRLLAIRENLKNGVSTYRLLDEDEVKKHKLDKKLTLTLKRNEKNNRCS